MVYGDAHAGPDAAEEAAEEAAAVAAAMAEAEAAEAGAPRPLGDLAFVGLAARGAPPDWLAARRPAAVGVAALAIAATSLRRMGARGYGDTMAALHRAFVRRASARDLRSVVRVSDPLRTPPVTDLGICDLGLRYESRCIRPGVDRREYEAEVQLGLISKLPIGISRLMFADGGADDAADGADGADDAANGTDGADDAARHLAAATCAVVPRESFRARRYQGECGERYSRRHPAKYWPAYDRIRALGRAEATRAGAAEGRRLRAWAAAALALGRPCRREGAAKYAVAARYATAIAPVLRDASDRHRRDMSITGRDRAVVYYASY